MKPLYWILGIGGLGALWFATRAKAAAVPEGGRAGAPIPDVQINPPPASVQVPETNPSVVAAAIASKDANLVASLKGPLIAILNVRATSAEKAQVPQDALLKNAMNSTLRVARDLMSGKCPGMPLLEDVSPAVQVKDVPEGWEFTVVWPAIWGSTARGNVRVVVLNCIIAQMRKIFFSSFDQRFISLQVYRA